ncbi:hypothetical protein GXW84_42845 [Rhodococcus sp. IEGM 248]|nr:hypothetical protein [Rhodococcus sp. IEGM 248]
MSCSGAEQVAVCVGRLSFADVASSVQAVGGELFFLPRVIVEGERVRRVGWGVLVNGLRGQYDFRCGGGVGCGCRAAKLSVCSRMVGTYAWVWGNGIILLWVNGGVILLWVTVVSSLPLWVAMIGSVISPVTASWW